MLLARNRRRWVGNMPKRTSTPRVADQICPPEYHAKRGVTKLDARVLYGERDPVRPARKISYIAGEPPKQEPLTIPRLCTRGLIGGSFKIDLLGLNIGLSNHAFSQWICDESLAAIHVHRGDIAIIDPMRILKRGDIVMVLEGGREVFRRLIKKRGVWFLMPLDDNISPATLLLRQPIYGVALGFLRLCVAAKAVNYANTEIETGNPERKMLRRCCRTEDVPFVSSRGKRPYPRPIQPPFILASEGDETRYACSKGKKREVKGRAKKRAEDA